MYIHTMYTHRYMHTYIYVCMYVYTQSHNIHVHTVGDKQSSIVFYLVLYHSVCHSVHEENV